MTISRPTIKAVTLAPSRLENTGAVLNGYVNPKNVITEGYVSGVGFEYRKSGDAAWISVDAVTGETFSRSVSGLTADTDYIYRSAISLTDGGAAFGEEVTFHTPPVTSTATGSIEVSVVPEDPGDNRELFVNIEEGNDVIASKDLGAFSNGSTLSAIFDRLPNGNYNLVVRTRDGDFTETRMVSVTDNSATRTIFTVPLGKVASVVEVKESDPSLPTPKIAVEGLTEIITQEDMQNAAAGNQDVEVKLEVENVGQNAQGAEELSKLHKIDTFLDIELFKTITELDAQGHPTSIKTNDIGSSNSVVLEIAIPYSHISGRTVRMFSYHNNVAMALRMLTTKPAGGFRDGTFFVDLTGGYIFLYANKFSTYAIAFEDSTPAPSGGSGGGGGGGGSGSTAKVYRIVFADVEHGSVTASAKEAESGRTIQVTVTPENGYLTDSVTVKTAADKTVSVTKSAENVFSFTMPASDVTVSAAFVKQDADSSDTETNAAPEPLSPEETGVSEWLITDEHPVYIRGFSDGTFRPNNNITRAQAAMMFYRLLKNPDVARTKTFNDMNGDEWYAEAVYALSSLGIIQGYSDGTFHGNESISRAAFTAIATRFAKATASYESYGVSFIDVPESHWAKETIARASYYGWIGGYADGSFHPADPISRAAVTAIINRMLGRSADQTFVTDHRDSLKQFTDVQDTGAWYYYNVAEAANGHSFTKSDGKESWSGVNP